jgi:hypothetical protein
MARMTRSGGYYMMVAVIFLCSFALTGFVFWLTHSGWAFLILMPALFVQYDRKSLHVIKTECPKCNHKFVAREEVDEKE